MMFKTKLFIIPACKNLTAKSGNTWEELNIARLSMTVEKIQK